MLNASKLIKSQRLIMGVSQPKLGRFLGHTSGQFISNFERCNSPLPLKSLFKACEYLGIKKKHMATALLMDYELKIKQALKENL